MSAQPLKQFADSDKADAYIAKVAEFAPKRAEALVVIPGIDGKTYIALKTRDGRKAYLRSNGGFQF